MDKLKKIETFLMHWKCLRKNFTPITQNLIENAVFYQKFCQSYLSSLKDTYTVPAK